MSSDPAANMDNQFATDMTKTVRKAEYGSISPTRPELSQAGRTVLITGCSDGGMGAALAMAFHEANFHVYATARDPKKMTKLQAAGIETISLDVTSDSSIKDAVSKLSSLDILVNNIKG